MVKKDVIKMAVIAGASYALKYKERNPRASESEIMNYISKEMGKIVENVED